MSVFCVVLVCHLLVLDGFDQLLSFCTVHSLSSAAVNKSQQHRISGTPRIEPGTAGWEARTLPLCYAVPPKIECLVSRHGQKKDLVLIVFEPKSRRQQNFDVVGFEVPDFVSLRSKPFSFVSKVTFQRQKKEKKRLSWKSLRLVSLQS